MSTHPSRFSLEQNLAGELASVEQAHIVTHLDGCSECRSYVEQLERDRSAFRQEVPYAQFRIDVEKKRVAEVRRPAWWRWAPIFATGGALTFALFFALQPLPPDSGIRLKGTGTELSFVVQTPEGARAGVSGETLAPGSTLQLSYDAGDYSHMALLGIDGRGEVTVYFPEGKERMERAPSGSHGALPFSLTLDDGPGPERFVAVFSRGAARLDELVSAARAAKPDQGLMIPLDMVESSFTVRKP